MTDEKHADDQYYEDDPIRRHGKLRQHHEDRIPMHDWRKYAIVFLIGVGFAAAGRSYVEQWKKRHEPNQEQPEKPKKEYTKIDAFGRELLVSPKGRRLLNQLKDEIYARTIYREVGSFAQQKIASAVCDLASDDNVIDDKCLERELEIVFDDRTPVGKLWLSYKGPVPVPETTLEDKLKLRQIYEQWKRYRPIMMRLLDTDGNDGHSDEELNRAAYKILKQ